MSPDTPQPSAGQDRLPGSAPRRWEWYHFYFVLAPFNVVVIVASLVIHHRALRTYEVALGELGRVDAKQRGWVADLRLGVVFLNAPGNDVFESRNVGEERGRARDTQAMLRALIGHHNRYGVDLREFEARVEALKADQASIFEIFERIGGDQPTSAQDRVLLEEASVFMASMDRHSAQALDILSKIDRALIREQNRLHEGYGSSLERYADVEKYFLALVILILLSVLFYGRKLQEKHAQFELEQRRALRERQERLAAIGELSAAVAHGIRNPLAAITSSAQLALEFGDMDERTRGRVADVIQAADRLNRRSTRLLQFAQDHKPAFERFDLVGDVQDVIEELRPRFDELGVSLVPQFEDQAINVCGDRERIGQSLIELLSNSLDCLKDGGEVRVVCGLDPRHRDRAVISVIDNGPGIPDNLRQQVFDLFFSSKPEGSGVGLASVRRAVEMHYGEVKVVPQENGGAHIRIELPLRPPDDEQSA